MDPKRWEIEASASSVTFVATSSIHPIRTKGEASGWIEGGLDDNGFLPNSTLRGRLEVPLSGLLSGNPLVDNEMRRRVDTVSHPFIVCQIETTEDTGESTATITGTISFLDVDVLVEGELNLLSGPRLSGVGEFDVRWWGLEPPKLFMMRVDPIVTVEIDLLLI